MFTHTYQNTPQAKEVMLVENFFFEKITQLPSEVAQSLLAHLASLFGVIKKESLRKAYQQKVSQLSFFMIWASYTHSIPNIEQAQQKKLLEKYFLAAPLTQKKALRLIMCIDEKSYEASSYEEKLLADLHELAVLAHDKQIELPFTVLGKSPDVSDKLHAPKNVQLRLKETKRVRYKRTPNIVDEEFRQYYNRD